jgi:hypothetical protein
MLWRWTYAYVALMEDWLNRKICPRNYWKGGRHADSETGRTHKRTLPFSTEVSMLCLEYFLCALSIFDVTSFLGVIFDSSGKRVDSPLGWRSRNYVVAHATLWKGEKIWFCYCSSFRFCMTRFTYQNLSFRSTQTPVLDFLRMCCLFSSFCVEV